MAIYLYLFVSGRNIKSRFKRLWF